MTRIQLLLLVIALSLGYFAYQFYLATAEFNATKPLPRVSSVDTYYLEQEKEYKEYWDRSPQIETTSKQNEYTEWKGPEVLKEVPEEWL